MKKKMEAVSKILYPLNSFAVYRVYEVQKHHINHIKTSYNYENFF